MGQKTRQIRVEGYRSVEGYRRPWNIDQVAEYLGLSTRTVFRYVNQGLIPSTTIGGHRYFDPAKVSELAGIKD